MVVSVVSCLVTRGYNPLALSEATEKLVCKGDLRRYYRVARGGRWYGGIATADCCGCNLRCVFCWSGAPRDQPHKVGKMYSPEEVAQKLVSLAKKRGYRLVRISGNEPTIGRNHLLKVVELVEQAGGLTFILETNGILIGSDPSYAKDLSRFSKLHVRVSIKGTTPEEFHRLTGAKPEAFELQLQALKNLLDHGVRCHPAVMLSFSSREGREFLVRRLRDIDKVLVEEFEEEYVFLYPHVVERLRRAGITPRVAYSPDNIPEELV